jgi:hypothetical protein
VHTLLAGTDAGWSLNTLYFDLAAKRLLAANAALKSVDDPNARHDNGIANDAEELSIPLGCYPQALDVGLASPPRPREPHHQPGQPRRAGLGRQLVGRQGACWGAGVGDVREPVGGVGGGEGVVGGEGVNDQGNPAAAEHR